MLEQIASAHADLESNIDELRKAIASGGNGASLGQADAQLHGLSRLQHRIANANGASLVAIRAEVIASVAATQAFVQQTRGVTASAQTNEVSLHAASAAAHREVTSFVHDFYERKIFDPYLRFTSPEDEEAYRRRETERQEAIKAALAEGTPAANLRANQLAIEQLKDAGAHGADRSPDYQPRLDMLVSSGARLGAEIADPKAAKTAADPLSDLKAVQLPPDLVAAIGAAGIATTEPSTRGHGVTVHATRAPTEVGRLT